MRIDDLVDRAPTLVHTTAAEGWPRLRARGLLPTATLLEQLGVDPAERERLTTRRRPTATRFEDPGHGPVWIRDQQPLTESVLARMLTGSGWEVTDYLRRLNGLAFLWADRARYEKLRALPRYAASPQVELTVDTASLLAAHHGQVVLTRINSGAAIFPSGRRGPQTFVPLAEAPRDLDVVEVGVVGGIPDLARHLVAVRRRLGDVVDDLDPRACPDPGPA